MKSHEPPGTRIEGWKAVARYLGKDPRTALRWADLGLPVRRVNGANSSVYAYSDELEAWLRGRGGAGDAEDAGRGERAPSGPSPTGPPSRPHRLHVAARPTGSSAPPADTEHDLAELLRAAAEHVLDPDADPRALTQALRVACRAFIEALSPAVSHAPPATTALGVAHPLRMARPELRPAGPTTARARPIAG